MKKKGKKDRKPWWNWKNWKISYPHPVKVYTNDDLYEFAARQGWEEKIYTFQEFAFSRIFPKDVPERLDKLRKIQRKKGLDDTLFYHPKKLKAMGLKAPGGPRRRRLACQYAEQKEKPPAND